MSCIKENAFKNLQTHKLFVTFLFIMWDITSLQGLSNKMFITLRWQTKTFNSRDLYTNKQQHILKYIQICLEICWSKLSRIWYVFGIWLTDPNTYFSGGEFLAQQIQAEETESHHYKELDNVFAKPGHEHLDHLNYWWVFMINF